MPRRSNEFQKLVYLAKKHWTEATGIEESRMLQDRITGKMREVDVCITGDVGGHNLIVSLECVNRSRKADVTWVEQMKEKHARLPTNMLVLYASAGFTAEAVALAKASGIEAVALEQVEEGYVTELMGRSGDMVVVRYRLDPTKVVAVVPELGDLPAERVNLMPDNLVFYGNGTDAPSLRSVVDDFLHSQEVREQLVKEATVEHEGFVIARPDFLDKEGNELYIEKMEPKVFRRIAGLLVEGTCAFEHTRFPLRHGNLGELRVSWGAAEIDGRNTVLVVSPTKEGMAKLTITFGEVDS